MKKIYHLATCSTNQAILKQIGVDANKPAKGLLMQDIKTEKISAEQLDQMKNLAGSYEALFSRRALKYKALGLKDKTLTEDDYRNYILDEYTFLKRPVAIIGTRIFVGNDKKTVNALAETLKK